MSTGKCRLCRTDSELQLSHVLPAFVYRWLRETSGTGHMRFGTAPNKRMQDGLKRHWLCSSCESLLSKSETDFATQLFHPYLEESSRRFKYRGWLLLFCVSVSWRVLRFYREETSLADYPEDLLRRMDDAEETWKEVLLSKRPHPGQYRQHLLPLDTVEKATGRLESNINRYLKRAIDMDLVRGGTTNFVYSKLGRFVILGFIQEDHPSHWQGTKVHATEGTIEPRSYVLPKEFGEYLNSQAKRLAELNASISDRQRKKIDEAFWTNLDRVGESDAFRAMDDDVRLFGRGAFMHKQSTGENEP